MYSACRAPIEAGDASLDGLLVVAIEQAVAASTCTLRFADAGARVIKIERAGGETARLYDQTVLGKAPISPGLTAARRAPSWTSRKALGGILAGIFGAMTRREATARLEASKLAWSSVSAVGDLPAHAALRRLTVETPGDHFEGVASPLRRKIKDGQVPALGAHTDALRNEFAATIE